MMILNNSISYSEYITTIFVLSIITIFILMGILFSITYYFYCKKYNIPKRYMCFIPILKHWHFTSYAQNIKFRGKDIKIHPIILPLEMIVTFLLGYLGLKPFLVGTTIFIITRMIIFNGIFKTFKNRDSMAYALAASTLFSSVAFIYMTLMYDANKNKKKIFKKRT